MSYWGPPTWIYAHTLAEKIKDESFPIIGPFVIQNLIQIFYNLPCPECAQHSKEFWNNVNISNIKTKTDLINLLFVFHNVVNKRKQLQPFQLNNMNIYQTKSLILSFNIFAKNFNTKGNMKMLNESFHRNRLLSSLRTWMLTNISHFDL